MGISKTRLYFLLLLIFLSILTPSLSFSMERLSGEEAWEKLAGSGICRGCVFSKSVPGDPDEDHCALAELFGLTEEGFVDMRGINVSRSKFRELWAETTGACKFDFSDANMSDIEFENGQLFHSKMNRINLSGATFINAGIYFRQSVSGNFTNLYLLDGSYLSGRISDANFAGLRVQDAKIPICSNCNFDGMKANRGRIGIHKQNSGTSNSSFRNAQFNEFGPAYIGAKHLHTFKNCDFSGAAFANSSLKISSFINTNLDEVSMKNVDATGLTLTGSSMRSAYIYSTDISHTSLDDVDIESSTFRSVAITETSFVGANLSNSKWKNTKGSKARFTQAALENSHFSNVEIINSDFSQVNMSGAAFQDSDLSGGDFNEANMSNVLISGTSLSHANLTPRNAHSIQIKNSMIRNIKLNEQIPRSAIKN